MNRFLIFAGALCGASGVVLSAMGAHMGGGNLPTVALFLLVHAPVLFFVGMQGNSRAFTISGGILLIGTVLFAADLTLRNMIGQKLFPMAAPAGGTLMIAGWLAIAVSVIIERKNQQQ